MPYPVCFYLILRSSVAAVTPGCHTRAPKPISVSCVCRGAEARTAALSPSRKKKKKKKKTARNHSACDRPLIFRIQLVYLRIYELSATKPLHNDGGWNAFSSVMPYKLPVPQNPENKYPPPPPDVCTLRFSLNRTLPCRLQCPESTPPKNYVPSILAGSV